MALFNMTELPWELQLAIMEFLPRADLLHAARVSKRFCTTVQNVLYADITLEWSHERKPQLSRLLATLFAKPKLASCIKRLHLKGDNLDRDRYVAWRPQMPCLSVSDFPLKRARAFVDSIGLTKESQESWKAKLQQGNVHALTTLLICLAPNLSSLYLDRLFTVETDVLGHVLRQSLLPGHLGARKETSTLCVFRALRELVMLDRYDETRRTSLNNAADVLPLFYLPTIESIVLSIDNPVEFAWPAESPPKLAKLSSLDLRRIREQRLAPILAAASGLTTFAWLCCHVNGLDRNVSTKTIDLDAIISALAPLRNTVENLTIEAHSKPGRGDIEPPALHIAGSLAGLEHFHCVRRLSIPWPFVMGFSPSQNMALLTHMPHNLQELTLLDQLYRKGRWNWDADGREGDYESDDNEDPCARTAVIVDAVEGLDRAAFPSLATIMLDWLPEDDEQDQDQLRRLNRACRRLQIQVSWDQ
ncbi:hypothetical protein K4F52_009145 [Lecanicillium sp. MT-2017a]|nr:hypothetical protein K4F52_009145 [Lecanicillium sp. MT-2017a]